MEIVVRIVFPDLDLLSPPYVCVAGGRSSSATHSSRVSKQASSSVNVK